MFRWTACLIPMMTIALLLAAPSNGQRETQTPLKSNPYRDIGGSCVLGKGGEVLYAPKGKACADRRDHLSVARPPAPETRFAGLPGNLGKEAESLVRDHSHIADELSAMRAAIAANKRSKAIELSEKVVAELTDHLAREERFLDTLVAEHRTH